MLRAGNPPAPFGPFGARIGSSALLLRRAGAEPIPQRNPVLIKVAVRSNESLEAALRRFKRQCNYSGVFRLAKQNTWHEKRSDKRRRERRERMRTILKAARREQQRLRRS